MTDLRTGIESVLEHALSEEQWTAVSSPAEPSAIVAGAGSGKTTVMSARVLWLVMAGLALPDEVLGLTFTTKAAGELLSRTRRLLLRADRLGLLPDGLVDSGAMEPAISTYHSFASRLLRDHGVRLGLEPDAEVLADGARQVLAARVIRSTALPLAELGRSPASLVESVLALDDAMAELDLEPAVVLDHSIDLIDWLESLPKRQKIGDEMLQAARLRAALCGLVSEFREAKLTDHVIDFADQVRLALRIVRGELGCDPSGRGAASDMRDELRARYRFVLLDEYQDTSAAQRVLLQEIFGDAHPVTAVGDPCQAIYEWRGASVANIDRFPEHFRRAGGLPAARYPLVDNRRSAPRILALANDVAAPLRAVHPGVEPLRSAVTDRGSGEVVVALHETYAEEVDWACDRIVDLHERQGSWAGIAVLARTAATLVDVDRALRRRGVPTRLVGAAGLLQVPVVAELRAMLEVLDDPAADAALVRLLTGPRWRIGPRDLAALGAFAPRAGAEADRTLDITLRRAVLGSDPVDRPSLAESIESALARAASGESSPDLSSEAVERLSRLMEEIRRLRQHLDEPCVDIVARVLRTTGLGVEAAIGPDAEDSSRALADFREMAARMTRGAASGLTAFLARLREAEHYDESPRRDEIPTGDAVLLMTAHRAKGLEFPHVVIPAMTESVFPSGKGRSRWPRSAAVVPWAVHPDPPAALATFPDRGTAPTSKAHDEFTAMSIQADLLEERRLAYVALTRAERSLTVSGHWWGPSQTQPRGPGPFLDEIRTWCEDNGGHIAVWAPAPQDGESNPATEDLSTPWPPRSDPVRSTVIRDVALAVQAARRGGTDPAAVADPEISATVEQWDADISALLDEARRARLPIAVRVPDDLSTTALVRLAEDPDAFALDLARPMPRRPHPAARLGTEIHAWIEGQYAVQTLFDLEELDAADDLDTDMRLAELREVFARTSYAARAPIAVEEPFALVVGGRVIRGRIDAVFARPDGGVEVVDWKSGGRGSLSDLQLAIYRLAWAEMSGVPLDRITAAFVMLRTGEVITPTRLLERSDVERMLDGGVVSGP